MAVAVVAVAGSSVAVAVTFVTNLLLLLLLFWFMLRHVLQSIHTARNTIYFQGNAPNSEHSNRW